MTAKFDSSIFNLFNLLLISSLINFFNVYVILYLYLVALASYVKTLHHV
jgi:hypothetical protein